MKTVLVVDDDALVRASIGRVLEAAGYVVLEAGDGIEALDALARSGEAVAAVVLDLRMPRMNGRQFLAALRRDARYASLPVVVVSGALDGEVEGASVAVAKPIAREELLRLLRELIA